MAPCPSCSAAAVRARVPSRRGAREGRHRSRIHSQPRQSVSRAQGTRPSIRESPDTIDSPSEFGLRARPAILKSARRQRVARNRAVMVSGTKGLAALRKWQLSELQICKRSEDEAVAAVAVATGAVCSCVRSVGRSACVCGGTCEAHRSVAERDEPRRVLACASQLREERESNNCPASPADQAAGVTSAVQDGKASAQQLLPRIAAGRPTVRQCVGWCHCRPRSHP